MQVGTDVLLDACRDRVAADIALADTLRETFGWSWPIWLIAWWVMWQCTAKSPGSSATCTG